MFFEALNYETIEQKKAYEVAGLLGRFSTLDPVRVSHSHATFERTCGCIGKWSTEMRLKDWMVKHVSDAVAVCDKPSTKYWRCELL